MVVLRCKRPNTLAYPTELKTNGDHLRKVRLDRQLSQNQASTILGVSIETVANWELKRSKPRILYQIRINDFLGFKPMLN
jgi:DNA-binding transcriptional regulator YiaG